MPVFYKFFFINYRYRYFFSSFSQLSGAGINVRSPTGSPKLEGTGLKL